MHIVILAVVVVVLIWLVMRSQGRFGSARSRCNWHLDRRRASGSTARWTCRSCGVEVYSNDGRAPKECKRHLRDTRL